MNKTVKRIAAIVALVAIVGLYLVALIAQIAGWEFFNDTATTEIYTTIAGGAIIYLLKLIYDHGNKKNG